MSFGNTTETDLLNYIFDTAAPSWAANANFWIALYSADPDETGTAITNEISYTGYARVVGSRSTGFTVTGNTAENAALLQFPLCSGGTATATHFAVVTTASGAGQIIVKGALTSSLSISTNIQPQFNAGDLEVVLD